MNGLDLKSGLIPSLTFTSGPRDFGRRDTRRKLEL